MPMCECVTMETKFIKIIKLSDECLLLMDKQANREATLMLEFIKDNMINGQIFNFIKDRVWKKFKGWKEKTLSKAGREVLIKALAQAIPSYIMGYSLLPDSLCTQIEILMIRFF